MAKLFTAIADFANEGVELVEIPENKEELYAKIESVLAEYPTGAVIAGDDLLTLRSYLAAIGSDETTVAENGTLQGKGVIEKVAEGAGVTCKATSWLEVKSAWDRDRHEWSAKMDITKIGGDARVLELTFCFEFVSFGATADGQDFEIMINDRYERVFNDTFHINDFNNGGTAIGSRYDTSKFIQWGYFVRATCAVRTTEGTLLV